MENKTGKYFKYAIGEIILVVIGILIALQINNWNEDRKSRAQEQNYYCLLLENIQQDKQQVLQLKALNEERRNGSHEAILEIQKEKPKAEVFGKSWINALQRVTTSFKPNNATYSDIKSSGNLSIIQDKAITGALNTYYTNVAGYAETIIKNTDFIMDRIKSLDNWFETGVHQVNIFSRYNKEIFTEAIRKRIKEDSPEYISESYKPILYDAILITGTDYGRRQQLLELIENEVDILQQLLEKKCNSND
ncbi:hypothetical protein J4050_05105 [Winogradskyella sp. DF17]|uniref:Uncharacterized protein n=2 Tax=Winogradskyella pelagia TaxID=2819984 RepID=A0ABS3T044_9FLAO|nr:hypothetical protein [Winogradskyella sp. DF17]